jgi:hypothetical protein
MQREREVEQDVAGTHVLRTLSPEAWLRHLALTVGASLKVPLCLHGLLLAARSMPAPKHFRF